MRQIVILFCCSFGFAPSFVAQVGIGTTTPDASAKLQIDATNKGFLPPRVALSSLTDQTTIAAPAEGLLVYCTGTGGLSEGYYYWEGSTWVKMSNTANSLDMGYVLAWPSNATPPGYLLPLSGGTYNWADYPEFQAFNATYASQFITASTSTTFTLKNINSGGRFLRGSTTAGTDQDDATSLPTTAFTAATAGAHVHSVDPPNTTSSTDGSHNHTLHRRYNSDNGAYDPGDARAYEGSAATTDRSIIYNAVPTSSNGSHNHTTDIAAFNSASAGDHTHTISGGDAETRPINTSVIWVLKVKPTATTGNLTINNTYAGATSASNGLTLSSNNIKLGGTLSETTTIASAGNNLNFTGTGAVGIGTSTPAASAALDISSTSKGVLLPNMTSAQMNAIASPATGLLLFCSDCSPVGFRFYNGTTWSELMPVKQLAFYNTSATTAGNTVISWGDVRYNSVSTANMTWNTGFTSCTLSNGIYLVEWGTTRVQNDYTGIDCYLNSSIYRGGAPYSRAENGGGTNWGGNSRRYAVIDASTSTQVLQFKTDLSWSLGSGAELKIEKLD